jgi:hypothetical protein
MPMPLNAHMVLLPAVNEQAIMPCSAHFKSGQQLPGMQCVELVGYPALA